MQVQRDAAITLAEHVVVVGYEDIPLEAVEATKTNILDTLGCVLAGTSAPGVGLVIELVKDWGGKGESTILGYAGKVPSVSAALSNGTAGHARDLDDNHDVAQIHGGVVVVPAALAIAELKGGVSGKDFIVAVNLGLDLVGRIPLAMSHWFGWHPTPVFGVFSAAAAAGRLLGLDQEQMVNAFGIAYSQSAGTFQVIADGALTKRLHAGLAAKAGVLSALLAQKGLKGIRNSLEGEYGLYNQYFRGEYDVAPVMKQLGKKFEATNIGFKPYPCCRDLHVSIDATLALVKEHDITAEQVKSITVGVNAYNYHDFCEPAEVKIKPRTIVDAQFSVQYVVATAIVDRKVVIDNFTDAAIKRPEILALTKKITCRVDPEIEQVTAGTMVTPAAKVEIKTKDGKIYSKQVNTPKGHHKNPMTPQELQAKFRDCASYSVNPLPKDNVEKVIAMLTNLEEVEDVTSIPALLC